MFTETHYNEPMAAADIPILSLVDWWNGCYLLNNRRIVVEEENVSRQRKTVPKLVRGEPRVREPSSFVRLPLLDLRSSLDNETQLLKATEGQREERKSLWDSPSQLEPRCRIKVVHIPLDCLRERSYELPPRDVAFGILVSTFADLEQAKQIILHTNEQQRAWKVKFAIVLEADDDTNVNDQAPTTVAVGQVISALHRLTSDRQTVSGSPCQPHSSLFRPLDRLWKPDPMVEHVLLPTIIQTMFATTTTHCNVRSDERMEIWDLGAGAGRDVCFLAEELKAASAHVAANHPSCLPPTNFCVVAVDQRYRSDHQKVCHQFWQRRRVADVTDTKRLDLNDVDATLQAIQDAQRDDDIANHGVKSAIRCLYAVRFWNRPMIEGIARTTVLQPGTIFAISQFGKPHPGAEWKFAHPKVPPQKSAH